MELFITKHIQIQEHRVWLNGIVEYTSGEESFGKFIRSVYRHYDIRYPKFFKMDNLCKLAFLSAEILFQGTDIHQKYEGQEIGIILENASSSLEYDKKHVEIIRNRNNYFPKPSIFVYTIPNIMLAEIAIRHNVKGENAVFLFEKFHPEFIDNYVSQLLRSRQVGCCLSGWIECYGDQYQSFLFMIEQEDKIKRCKGLQEYDIFNRSSMEKLFKGKVI